MKLQRNNKYKNKIAAGLSAIIIASASLLTGCGSNDVEIVLPVETIEPMETPEPYEEYVETTPTPEPTPVPTPTMEEDIESIGIVNEDAIICDADKFGIIFRMPDGNIKVIDVLYEAEGNDLTFYDIYTETPILTAINFYQDKYYCMHYDEVEILVPYFENAKLAVLGTQVSVFNYVHSEFGEEVNDADDEIAVKYYGLDPYDPRHLDRYFFSKREHAEMYIMLIPRESRVTIEELQTGLEKDSVKVLK